MRGSTTLALARPVNVCEKRPATGGTHAAALERPQGSLVPAEAWRFHLALHSGSLDRVAMEPGRSRSETRHGGAAPDGRLGGAHPAAVARHHAAALDRA